MRIRPVDASGLSHSTMYARALLTDLSISQQLSLLVVRKYLAISVLICVLALELVQLYTIKHDQFPLEPDSTSYRR